jgi:hypothetical protein
MPATTHDQLIFRHRVWLAAQWMLMFVRLALYAAFLHAELAASDALGWKSRRPTHCVWFDSVALERSKREKSVMRIMATQCGRLIKCLQLRDCGCNFISNSAK